MHIEEQKKKEDMPFKFHRFLSSNCIDSNGKLSVVSSTEFSIRFYFLQIFYGTSLYLLHKKLCNGDICTIGFLSLILTLRQWIN